MTIVLGTAESYFVSQIVVKFVIFSSLILNIYIFISEVRRITAYRFLNIDN